ncbi:MAG: M20/M25/M40 family metallo-hydrolase [Thermomicrobiales bacterium]
MARLHELPLAEHPRMAGSRTVLSMHAGSAQYVMTLPELATVQVNRMIVPGETRESVVAELRGLADSLGSAARFDLTIDPPCYPSWETDPEHPLARSVARAYEIEAGKAPDWRYTGFGDMNLFSDEAGIPTVMIGPKGDNYHQPNEWVSVSSISATARLLVDVVREMLPA